MQIFSSKAAKVTFLQFADQLLQVFFFIGLTRTCDLTLLGTYLTLTAFWGLGSMMIDFGLNHVLIKESAQKYEIFAISAMVISVKGMGVCILLVCLFIWSAFSSTTFVPLLIFSLPIIGLRCTGSALSSVIIGRGKMFSIALFQFCARVLLVISVWLSLGFTISRSIEVAILCHFVVESALVFLFWWLLGRPGLHYFDQLNYEKCKQLCKSGSITGLTTSGILLLIRQPLFWMEFFSSDQTALYALAVRGVELLLIPVNVVLLISLPQAVKCKKKTDQNIASNSNKFSFFQKTKPLFIFFISISILNKFCFPFNVCVLIAPKLAPLDQVLWALFAIAGLITILYSLCFDLFVTNRLHIALWMIAIINAVVAMKCNRFFISDIACSLEESLNILNIALIFAILGIYILKGFFYDHSE